MTRAFNTLVFAPALFLSMSMTGLSGASLYAQGHSPGCGRATGLTVQDVSSPSTVVLNLLVFGQPEVPCMNLLLGIVGDANGDGVVDGADFLIWQRGYGHASNFDARGDVDGNDFVIWQRTLGGAAGDADIDGEDFLLWQQQFGAGADADGNGVVDGRDFLIWQRQLNQVP